MTGCCTRRTDTKSASTNQAVPAEIRLEFPDVKQRLAPPNSPYVEYVTLIIRINETRPTPCPPSDQFD